MKILVTGGLGNIGRTVVREGRRRGHEMAVFDIPSKHSRKFNRNLRKEGVEIHSGDITKYEDIRDAVGNCDAVIHLAAILPPASEKNPGLCRAVNVEGTANLIRAMKECASRPVLVEVSSASVMGPTQGRTPPVRAADPSVASDMYSRTKIEAERLVEASGIRHCTLRLAAVLPTFIDIPYMIGMIRLIYDMPLEARCEMVFDVDVASALVSAAENLASNGELAGKTGFIGGGREMGCQVSIREMLLGMLTPLGLVLPEESLFSQEINSYYLDWYDTTETQRILQYQNHSFEEWKGMIVAKFKAYRWLVVLFRGGIMKFIEGKSAR